MDGGTIELPYAGRPRLTMNELFASGGYVGGEWRDRSHDDKRFPVVNKADGEALGDLPSFGAPEVIEAVAAAENAGRAWASRTAGERSSILKRWHRLILENQDDLAAILTAEQGKPLAEARGEIAFGAAFVEWYAEEAKRVYGDVLPTYAKDRRIVVTRQPLGVVAAITPWNFPNGMVLRKLAPALAVGCTVVVKPAEDTPYSCLALALLAERAGVPPGVLNVIVCSADRAPEVGRALTADPRVRGLSFTGSTEVGKLLMRQCADTVKVVGLELGGNAPFIVFDDADVDLAVSAAIASKFRASGQTCVCANRILVQRNIYEQFSRRLVEAVAQLTVGRGCDPGTAIGPLINQAAVEKVERHVDDVISKGGKLLYGGKRLPKLGACFFEPTVVADVSEDMALMHEETFGPLAPLMVFDTEADALRIANNTVYGLAGYFFTRDLNRAWRVAEAIECGSIAINTGSFSSEAVPVGGFKESGVGREGSRLGVEDYLEVKQICFAGL
jgi:succinate-semialdehyde dehydrogenase / glutarate-semialdehyde dehydrogenase